MPTIPNKLAIRLDEMRRAENEQNMEDFMRATIKSFEEIEQMWSKLHDDIKNVE